MLIWCIKIVKVLVLHTAEFSFFSDAQVEKVGNPKTSVKTERAQTECHEIEPNPSKDRATCMPEGDNPAF